MSIKLFAVDHQTGKLITQLDDTAGMFYESVRVPMLLGYQQGYHVLELPSEWCPLISSGLEHPGVLMQYAQLRSSWRVDEPSYDPFLPNQIKLEREDETDADPIEE